MKVGLGSNASFLWRSLLAGWMVVAKGCRWKVGMVGVFML